MDLLPSEIMEQGSSLDFMMAGGELSDVDPELFFSDDEEDYDSFGHQSTWS